MKILYQDENILAVEKVSGLITHRNEWSAQGEPAALQIARDLISTKVYPVHRLDRSTSGVLLFTKSSESARSVKELFDSGHVQKTYIALVRGWLKETVKVDRQVDGKDALSLFEPIAHLCFSTRTCLPAFKASIACSKCSACQLAM